MITSTAAAYKYSVAGHLSFGAPKCEKAQKSSGFWANRTYWLCIKDNVLIDPACGAGALLVAFANDCRRQGINYQTSVLFTAQDIDYTVGLMCYLQLSLLGCPGYITIANTLTHPQTCLDRRGLIPRPGENIWYTPFYFRDVWQYRRLAAQMELLFSLPEKQDTQVTSKLKTQDEQAAQSPLPLKETKAGQLALF